MLFDLLTLADSNLPAGGYAFSNGLEAARHLGLLMTPGQLDGYLATAIFNTSCSELPFLQSCYANDCCVDDLLMMYDAMLTTQTMAQASGVQGRNLLRVMYTLYPSDDMHDLRQRLIKHVLPAHYTVVYGLTFHLAGFALAQTKQVFMYQVLRDQVSAAVRLGVVGPMEAAQVQKRHLKTCEAAIVRTQNVPYTGATRSAPQIDVAQSFHTHLYSRLFQS